MKGTKFLLAFWLSTATFCLLQIVFGPGGMSETAQLKDQKLRLETRLEALRTENLRLTARYEALRTSAEEVRLEARALGYFLPGETPVRTLGGVEFRLPSEEPDLSTVPPLPEDTGVPSLFFRLAWPVLFGLFLACFLLAERLWPKDGQSFSIDLRRKDNLPLVLQSGLDFFRK